MTVWKAPSHAARGERRASDFDIIHFHRLVAQALLGSAQMSQTLHGRLILPMPFLSIDLSGNAAGSISNARVKPYHHGWLKRFAWSDAGRLSIQSDSGGYLAFLGRISLKRRTAR
jgi:hypothetical protein